jgi:hypothetical protein
MRRPLILVILCVALATPVVASADDQRLPPEAHWTPTPPARASGAVNPLASALVDTGMLIPHASPPLTPPPVSSPAPHRRARTWTWDDIDHHRVRRAGGE